jgi:hypothetical protein
MVERSPHTYSCTYFYSSKETKGGNKKEILPVQILGSPNLIEKTHGA